MCTYDNPTGPCGTPFLSHGETEGGVAGWVAKLTVTNLHGKSKSEVSEPEVKSQRSKSKVARRGFWNRRLWVIIHSNYARNHGAGQVQFSSVGKIAS